MSTTPRTRRLLFMSPLPILLTAGALFLGVIPAPDASDHGVHVASSICEAHELKARAAEDPHFEVEIPAGSASAPSWST